MAVPRARRRAHTVPYPDRTPYSGAEAGPGGAVTGRRCDGGGRDGARGGDGGALRRAPRRSCGREPRGARSASSVCGATEAPFGGRRPPTVALHTLHGGRRCATANQRVRPSAHTHGGFGGSRRRRRRRSSSAASRQAAGMQAGRQQAAGSSITTLERMSCSTQLQHACTQALSQFSPPL